MYEPLCCPECGSTEFHQDRPEINCYKLTVLAAPSGPYLEDTGEAPECQDSERDEPIYCDDCGWELKDDELVTEEAFLDAGA